MPLLPAQEVDPPTITIPVTNTTTTTTPYIPPYGGSTQVPDIPIGIIAAIVAGILILVAFYYYKNVILKQLESLGTLHFNLEQFLIDTIGVDLGAYNRKFGVILMIILAAVIAVPTVIAQWVPDMTYRGGLILVGWAFCALGIIFYSQQLTIAEIKDNENSTWITAEIHSSGRGSKGRTLRRVTKDYEYNLSDPQRIQMAEKIWEVATNSGMIRVPTGGKKELINRLKELRLYKVTVKISDSRQYKLLIGSTHKWKDIANDFIESQFDRTTTVNITRMPLHMFYIGEGKEVFPQLDSKGLPAYAERTMGVFMAVINRQMVKEALMEGRFEAPSFRDALFLQMLHLYIQNSISAEYVDGKILELNKKKQEFDELRFKKVVEGQGQFNTFVRAFHRLFNPQMGRDKLKSWIMDMIFYGAIWYFIFFVIFKMGG